MVGPKVFGISKSIILTVTPIITLPAKQSFDALVFFVQLVQGCSHFSFFLLQVFLDVQERSLG